MSGDRPRPGLAAIWGVGRSLALEHPALRSTCIDVDGAADSMPLVLGELLSNGSEDQIAYRNGRRLVARLAALKPASSASGPCELIVQGGVLDQITFRPLERRAPGPGEVEVQVHAVGLNFRDVLNALGLYPGPPMPLGNECAGVVVAVGPGVSGVQPGDPVIAMAGGAFRSFVTTPQEFVFRMPPRLTFEQAASVPTVDMTAEWGLRHLAGLQPGQRVLIPSAAGGVGVAAINTARALGAEVIALAGSPDKRAYVRDQGVEHVFDSRSLEFVEPVRALTGGEGVHAVLNSLTGDFIPAFLSLLAPNGAFLEIGKRGIWTPERVREQHPTARYFVYDAGLELAQQREVMGPLFEDVLSRLGTGELAPPPVQVFPFERAADAFKHMAQARHIGKIAVSCADDVLRDRAGRITADAGYLVSGGTGALGLAVARWLVSRGARHVGLLSRRGAREDAQSAIDALRAQGADVRVITGDVGREADVKRALGEVGAPVRGVVHAAGITADASVENLTWDALLTVLQPKTDGAWHLDALTRGAGLDFFVLFSSVAGLLGAPGQANYSAANAWLDGLAWARRAAGEPALSVNWGVWAGGGMASQVPEAVRRAWDCQGVRPIAPEQGLRALEVLLGTGASQAAFLPTDWARVRADAQQAARPVLASVLAMLGRGSAGPADVQIRDQLREVSDEERMPVVILAVAEQVREVLGLSGPASDSRGRAAAGRVGPRFPDGGAVEQPAAAGVWRQRPTDAGLRASDDCGDRDISVGRGRRRGAGARGDRAVTRPLEGCSCGDFNALPFEFHGILARNEAKGRRKCRLH